LTKSARRLRDAFHLDHVEVLAQRVLVQLRCHGLVQLTLAWALLGKGRADLVLRTAADRLSSRER
jgi:hypothetical protein